MEAARERCLRLLSTRARSEAELRSRLRRAGFSPQVAEAALERLRGAGLVDDAEFARAWVEARRAAGGSGPAKLRWELRRKGVAEELIRRFVDEARDEQAELADALALARRRMAHGPADTAALGRLRRLLLRRGYGDETVESVMSRYLSEEG